MSGHERERPTTPSGPADPAWEAELRAGLEAEGGEGSVEPELEIARLLVHAARVETFDDAAAAKLWTDIERGIAPVPFWRRRWFTVSAPAALAAAAAVILVLAIGKSPKPGAEGGVASSADLLEQQFELLAPAARSEVTRTVEAERAELRGDLVALAITQGTSRTHGGAP